MSSHSAPSLRQPRPSPATAAIAAIKQSDRCLCSRVSTGCRPNRIPTTPAQARTPERIGPQRARLVQMLDVEHAARLQGRDSVGDLRISLSAERLKQALGSATVDALLKAFGGVVDTVKLRRVCELGACVAFHTDCSSRTMHVALNDESEYDGGRLVFATPAGFEVPSRPAGTATIHTDRVAHGVTTMQSGVRYSLFLCDSRQAHEQ